MTTAASLESSSLTLTPGEEVVVPLQIRNNGDVVEWYTFEVIGPTREWTTVATLDQGVLPGAVTTTTVVFHPPRSASVPSGRLSFGVMVTPTEHPYEAVVPEGVIDVLPFLETTAELIPRTSQGRRRGRHQVAIDNRGNVPVTAVLTGRDDGHKVDVAPKSPAVTVGPGEAAILDVAVKPRKWLWKGALVTHPFEVEVAPQDSVPVTLQGSYVQQPVLPPWLWKAALALAALVAALLLLWFVLLKPTIRSEAKDAVAPQVQKAQKQADQASQAANDAGKAATNADQSASSAQQAADDTQQVAKNFKPAPIVSNPLARRLVATGPIGDSYTVPARNTLQVTDVVLGNPQGDFGTMTVTADGNPLFVVALENFRDLDYHFVTPITVEAGKKIEVSVDCRRPGRPPGAAQAATCSDSLYLGGDLEHRATPPR